MDARCTQFHVDAQKPLTSATAKEIAKLKKFLFKNQDFKFTDSDQSQLFSAIQCHVTAYAGADESNNQSVGLLEDALKMPFNVFSTRQKKTFLKWLNKATGKGEAGTEVSAIPEGDWWDVIEIDGATCTLMAGDGETRNVPMTALGEAADVHEAFKADKAVRARCTVGNDGTVVVESVRIGE
eukprot:GDKH01010901.1.p1 GENE.GDKH01010901.1~~GDKH01010901.1.p1  ORF type:complete len:182 (+),score=14.53 GDKH01010901.1:114-659(+)